MKVKELIEILQKFNGELEVLVPAAGSVELYKLTEVAQMHCAEDEDKRHFYLVDPEEYAPGDDDSLRRITLWRS